MNSNNTRIEPTFGRSPDAEKVNTITNPHTISVSSKTSPGHTFTPVLTRPMSDAMVETPITETTIDVNPTVETAPTQSTPKTAGFAFAPVSEKEEKSTVEKQETKPDQPEKKESELERVIPVKTQHSLEKQSAKVAVPAKYRRLILVALLAIVLLLVFILLKPTTPKTVEALEEQGTSMPIEFTPVDEAEAKRAEEQAKALKQAQQETAQAETAVVEQPVITEMTNTNATMPAIQAVENTAESATIQPVVTPATVKAVAEEERKPQSTQSVIHQAERSKVVKAEPKKVERLKPSQVKAETAKPAVASKPKAETQAVSTSKPQTTPVATASQSQNGIVSTKMLTVPKGVSLMQIFRDNQLNISDVNAMSKANNAVSHLKVGEKVTVRLDKNSRVAEMQIGVGKYIRQANGSYIFK